MVWITAQIFLHTLLFVSEFTLFQLHPPDSFSSGLHLEPQDTDEALALRLQQELDREAAAVPTVDLEDGGLFFCQICHKDLSHMSPEGRTQHLNRFGYFYLRCRHILTQSHRRALKDDPSLQVFG